MVRCYIYRPLNCRVAIQVSKSVASTLSNTHNAQSSKTLVCEKQSCTSTTKSSHNYEYFLSSRKTILPKMGLAWDVLFLFPFTVTLVHPDHFKTTATALCFTFLAFLSIHGSHFNWLEMAASGISWVEPYAMPRYAILWSTYYPKQPSPSSSGLN